MSPIMNQGPATKAGERSLFETLVAPTKWLMDRLSYLRKFALIGVLFLIPLAAVTILQSSAATKDKVFNEKEVHGTSYLIPVSNFLNAVHRHRILALGVQAGDSAFVDALNLSARDADAAVAEVNGEDDRYGVELGTLAKWPAIKALWAVAKAPHGSLDDTDKAHADLDAAVLDFIVNVISNNSNLILDPDLDSYWLMDAVVAKLPSMEESLVAGVALAVRPGADASTQLDRRLEGSGYHRALVNTVADLEAINFATAFAKVDEFSKSVTLKDLKEPLGQTREDDTSIATQYRQVYLVASAPPNLDARHRLIEQSVRALNTMRGLASKVSPELSRMCQRRANAASNVRTLGITLSLLATLFILFIFAGFFLSVKGSVDQLRGATLRMIAGTDETFSISSRDELGLIAGSYNEINGALANARVLGNKMEKDNRQIEADVMQLLQVVADASDGKLYVRAKVSEGTVGTVSDAFNQLMDSISSILKQVTDQLGQTNKGVSAIVGSAESVLLGAESQATEVRSATDVVQQIVDQTEKVASTAQEAASAAQRAEKTAADGGAAVDTIAVSMNTLRASVQTGAKKVKSLGDRSMEITGIVGTINRIAEQTNMLALNAAIEAARAGENGRGFSVVAEEIRKLAERAAVATQEIDKLVRSIQVETQETVTAIEQQTTLVEQQGDLVTRAGDALSRIREVSTSTTALVAQIMAGTRVQVDGTGLITKTVGRIADVTAASQNDARSTVTVATDLRRLSELLAKSMSQFKLN
jgi:methyl-accepting chemotaxis protein